MSRNFASLFLRCFCFVATLIAASCFGSDITGQWTGIDRTNFQAQKRFVNLTLEEVASPPVSNFPQRTLFDSPELEKRYVEGKMLTTIPNLRRGGSFEESFTITGNYYPEVRAFVFYFYVDGRIGSFAAQIGILSPDGKHIAFFHTGAARSILPWILAKGAEAPENLPELAGFQSKPMVPVVAGAIPNPSEGAQQRKAQQQSLTIEQEFVKRQQEIYQDIAEAARAGDQQRILELQKEQQQLIQNLAGARRGETTANSTLATQPHASTCPEHILAWANEMDKGGASHQDFDGLVQVANIFRPQYFVPHFGEPFDELEPGEMQKISRDFQMQCLKPGSPLYTSRSATALAAAFTDSRDFGKFDAASAALALDTLEAWYLDTANRIRNSGTIEKAEAFDAQLASLASNLLPNDRDAAKVTSQTVISEKAAERIEKQLTPIISSIEQADPYAISQLNQLRHSGLFEKMTPEFAANFDQKFWAQVDPVISSYLSGRIVAFKRSGDSIATLAAGHRWYSSVRGSISVLQGRDSYTSFLESFSQLRESAYQDAKASLLEKLAAIDNADEATAFASTLSIPLDNSTSPTWRTIDAARAERIRKIEWAQYVDRVGDGPFDPYHPGAIYLNAIYRGDRETIAQQDKIFQDKLFMLAKPLLDDGMIDGLAQVMTMGQLPDLKLSEIMIEEIKGKSMLDLFLASFVVSYHDAYKNSCPDTRWVPITVTTTWYKVDSLGSRTFDSQNKHEYLVKDRHVDAWKSFEGTANTEGGLRFMQMISQFLAPQNGELSLYDDMLTVVRGIEKAMTDYGCDHDVITTLEQNMLGLFEGGYVVNGNATNWRDAYSDGSIPPYRN